MHLPKDINNQTVKGKDYMTGQRSSLFLVRIVCNLKIKKGN